MSERTLKNPNGFPEWAANDRTQPAFEIFRPSKGEHVKIWQDGRVVIDQMPAHADGLRAEIAAINRIPSLLREAKGEALREGIAALKASLAKAYDLVFRYWNEDSSRDYSGDEAKELRRAIWEQCLKPHGIEHPKGWA